MTAGLRASLSAGRRLLPGIMIAALVSASAQFVSDHYGAPAMLMALLIGQALAFLAEDERFAPGLAFCARHLLRFGVVLLGLRISTDTLRGLSPAQGATVVVLVAATILLGLGLARLFPAAPVPGVPHRRLGLDLRRLGGDGHRLDPAARRQARPRPLFHRRGRDGDVEPCHDLLSCARPGAWPRSGADGHPAWPVDPRRGAGGRRGLLGLARDRRDRDPVQAAARRHAGPRGRPCGADAARAAGRPPRDAGASASRLHSRLPRAARRQCRRSGPGPAGRGGKPRQPRGPTGGGGGRGGCAVRCAA